MTIERKAMNWAIWLERITHVLAILAAILCGFVGYYLVSRLELPWLIDICGLLVGAGLAWCGVWFAYHFIRRLILGFSEVIRRLILGFSDDE